MILPSLRQLRFLVALSEELHFGRAAEACFVTQSTLSTGIQELEDILGAPVAERSKRSVLMTPLGEELAARARVMLAEAQDMVELAQSQSGTLRGTLKLGTIPTVGPFLFPRLLPRLRQDYPDLRLYMREELTEHLIAGLRAGRLDVILIALPFETGDLEIESLFEDDYQLATAPGHRLISGRAIGGPDLDDETLLLLERGHCLQRHALSAFPESHAKQDETFAATSLPTLVAMVEEGLGITLLPQLAIDAGVTRNTEIELTPLFGTKPREVVLAWRKSSARSADFHRLAGLLREERARLGG
ncbi:hydrogen peroxide-inducible genes activator [Celeribacter neptunius]|uniref:LysR family transcriptional regulator, hydrogen peroxide-inducible genes activator n=1 Tax=Celeribacter neptunius TaxID=588602 RepID=A0A1I3UTQ0_9RHOB|nr:hydrogen peroxide-inducible genes activator [Celeribacter neptunius]SFJ85231.1 LysR family transcriptional regulator, hydrogen peroxide-inducible genes activator [Celeribacter neptunius]